MSRIYLPKWRTTLPRSWTDISTLLSCEVNNENESTMACWISFVASKVYYVVIHVIIYYYWLNTILWLWILSYWFTYRKFFLLRCQLFRRHRCPFFYHLNNILTNCFLKPITIIYLRAFYLCQPNCTVCTRTSTL